MCGEPGDWLCMAESISSALNSTSGPPLSIRRFHMNAALYAVSLASEPAMAVKTLSRPFGATFSTPASNIEAQSCCGKFPRAGLLIIALAISGDVAAARSDGLLYPTGIEAI